MFTMQETFPIVGGTKPRESKLEKDAWKYAESRGWYRIKIMRASRSGFPDHFFIRSGEIILIEFKRKGEDPSPLQDKEIKELRRQGARVEVVDNLRQARAILR